MNLLEMQTSLKRQENRHRLKHFEVSKKEFEAEGDRCSSCSRQELLFRTWFQALRSTFFERLQSYQYLVISPLVLQQLVPSLLHEEVSFQAIVFLQLVAPL